MEEDTGIKVAVTNELFDYKIIAMYKCLSTIYFRFEDILQIKLISNDLFFTNI